MLKVILPLLLSISSSGLGVKTMILSNGPLYDSNDNSIISRGESDFINLWSQDSYFRSGNILYTSFGFDYALMYYITNSAIDSYEYRNQAPVFSESLIYISLVFGARPINSFDNFIPFSVAHTSMAIDSTGLDYYMDVSWLNFHTIHDLVLEVEYLDISQSFDFNGYLTHLWQLPPLITEPSYFLESALLSIEPISLSDFRLTSWVDSSYHNNVLSNWFSYDTKVVDIYYKNYTNDTTIVDYENGYNSGYSDGFEDGFINKGLDNWLVSLFGGLGALLNIQILPNLTIGSIIMIFLAIPLTYAIIKLMKGGGD